MDGDILLKQRTMVVKNAPKRMSTLLFWQGRKGSSSPNGRNWIHQPELLVKGHVAYLVKFLGSTPVDQPKGIEVVKDAIKKLNFNQQLKAKENGKCKKVEITISVDGVAIQEPRSNNIMHQFPLHRISYCADDKGAKKYFSFIAKSQTESAGLTNGDAHEKERHECFVFVSTKLAAEITLTIGQAFDLAYRRFMSDSGKYLEVQKLQLLNKKLELQVSAYRSRLLDLARLTYKDDLQGYLSRSGLADVVEFKVPADISAELAALAHSATPPLANGNTSDLGLDLSTSLNSNETYSSGRDSNLLLDSPVSRAEPHNKNPVVGTKLEGLLLNSDSDSDFDPRACEEPPASRAPPRLPDASRDTPADAGPPPLLAPPPKTWKRHNAAASQPAPNQNGGSDLFGSTPFSVSTQPAPAPTQPAPFNHVQHNNLQNLQSAFTSNTPNYDISDFSMTNSVFNNANTFTNGLAGYDPFDTRPNGMFNGSNGFNGFGGLSEKQSVALDSNFSGFLDQKISEMKDGFSRGIAFGNDDFNIDHLDPLKKN